MAAYEGPMVRICLPPAESPCLVQTPPLPVENPGVRAGVRGWGDDAVGRDAQNTATSHHGEFREQVG